jgi:hypothetical protein
MMCENAIPPVTGRQEAAHRDHCSRINAPFPPFSICLSCAHCVFADRVKTPESATAALQLEKSAQFDTLTGNTSPCDHLMKGVRLE